MATVHVPPESADVIQSSHFPPVAAARMAASLLNRHSPHEIAEAIEVLVDVLDLIGGDPDEEENGDELDGSGSPEEDFGSSGRNNLDGPGCPLADPSEDVGDAEQETWSHPDDHPAELFIARRK